MPLLDNFNRGAAGADINAIGAGDSGHTWAKSTVASSASSMVVSSTPGRIRLGSTTFGCSYLNNWTPAGRSYDASAKVVIIDNGSNGFFYGPAIYCDGEKCMNFMLKSNGTEYRAICEYLWNYSQPAIAVGTAVTPTTGAIQTGWSGTLQIEGRWRGGVSKIYDIYCYVQRDSDGQWLKSDGTWQATRVACITAAYDDAPRETGGYPLQVGSVGLRGWGTANNTTVIQIDQVTGTDYSPALQAGTLQQQNNNTSLITINAGAALNGALPLSRELRRYPDPAILGAYTVVDTEPSTGNVSAIYTDPSPNAGPNWYREYILSAGGAENALSNLVTAFLLAQSEKLGIIGDSNLAGYGASNLLAAFEDLASYANGVRVIGARVNKAESGTSTFHWESGSRINTARDEFLAAGVTRVLWMLGTNDAGSTTLTQYESRTANGVSVLTAAGLDVYLIGPPYAPDRAKYCWDCRQRLANVAAANPKAHWLNDGLYMQIAESYAAGRTAMLEPSDNIHITAAGGTLAGRTIYAAFAKLVYGSTGGGTGQVINGGLIR